MERIFHGHYGCVVLAWFDHERGRGDKGLRKNVDADRSRAKYDVENVSHLCIKRAQGDIIAQHVRSGRVEKIDVLG